MYSALDRYQKRNCYVPMVKCLKMVANKKDVLQKQILIIFFCLTMAPQNYIMYTS